MLPKKLVFIDVETTGTSPHYDRVIEVGLVRVEDGQEVSRYQTLIDPDQSISPFIVRYTGITPTMLAGAPSFRQIAADLHHELRDAVFVAHNVRFDFSFLKSEFNRVGLAFQPKQLCTVKLSRRLYPEMPRHNLDAVIERFGLRCPNRHRALDDAHVLWQFWQRLVQETPISQLETLLEALLKQPTLPATLTDRDINQLPNNSGVYIFRGQKQYPLYVGKSINIRDRVRDHLRNDAQTKRHLAMCAQIESIETIETAGELGALMTESDLVKQLQPLYNQLLRRKSEMVVLRQTQQPDGYLSATFERIRAIDPNEIGEIIGLFESERRLKKILTEVAQNFRLCPRLLSLERSTGACFSYQLDACDGACIGQEHYLKYNLRFVKAFSANKIRPWPYPGPIVITETQRDGERAESFLVDKWCLLGRSSQDEPMEESLGTYHFDLDTYKILRRFILEPAHQRMIRPMPSLRVR